MSGGVRVHQSVHEDLWSVLPADLLCPCGRTVSVKLSGDLMNRGYGIEVEAWHGTKRRRRRVAYDAGRESVEQALAAVLAGVRMYKNCGVDR